MKEKRQPKPLVPLELRERVRRDAMHAKRELERQILASHPLIDKALLTFYLEGFQEGYETGALRIENCRRVCRLGTRACRLGKKDGNKYS